MARNPLAASSNAQGPCSISTVSHSYPSVAMTSGGQRRGRFSQNDRNAFRSIQRNCQGFQIAWEPPDQGLMSARRVERSQACPTPPAVHCDGNGQAQSTGAGWDWRLCANRRFGSGLHTAACAHLRGECCPGASPTSPLSVIPFTSLAASRCAEPFWQIPPVVFSIGNALNLRELQMRTQSSGTHRLVPARQVGPPPWPADHARVKTLVQGTFSSKRKSTVIF